MKTVWALAVAFLLFVGTQGFAHSSELAVRPYQTLFGEIVEVFPEEGCLYVQTGGTRMLLTLADDVEIYRQEQLVTLRAARPVFPGRFQEGVFFLDGTGKIRLMIVHYRVHECEGWLLIFDLWGNVKKQEQL